ncbi:MAG: alpha/beta hydrolase [Chloroflexota bacterium]
MTTRSLPPIPSLLPGAEPFFFRGGAAGCLCLHGLSASPDEVRWLGEHLADQGLTVYGPRLPCHGGDYRDLRRVRWEDWYRAALDGYHILRAQCSQVFVAGLSMGGLLALLLATAQPVDALVVMAAPLKLPDARLMPLARWIKHFQPFVDASDRSTFPEHLRSERARRGEVVRGRVRYDRWASRAVEELHKLMQVVDLRLSDVNTPTLLLYSAADTTVPIGNQHYLSARLSRIHVETATFQESGHILTQDREHTEVIRQAGDFLLRHVRTESC